MSTLLILPCEIGAPDWNMAADEALLLTASTRALPLLRFYGWSEPAATFGYSQRYAEVAATTRLRPLIRRPTGGGIVPHDRDWTYSLAVPPGHPWHALSAIESYRTMHQWIVDAFAALSVPTELAPCCVKTAPGQCFVGHERFDVLWHGRKIAGAAQRRNRHGLLIQGSVQPPPSCRRTDWEEAMSAHPPHPLLTGTLPAKDDPAWHSLAERLREERYSRTSYNEGR